MVMVALALLSGVFGRMGGAGKSGQWYDQILDTKWRDIGCSLIIVIACWMFLGWHPWVYLAVFGLSWAAFSTYWDKLFGYDCFWFSGLLVGLAAAPLLFINIHLWPLVLGRIIILTGVWQALNLYLPEKVLCWRRDVVEEFCRYAVAI